ncbi:cell division suppressor protein YneA [Schnuerera ultunensis]|uniref:cell division suppressor protein YneA n=1 Tax=Schnuerera ultunensis TaxID=45497 RepID=UPI0003F5D1FD|nr:LysM peptidoglycan-binding domain-containing protein [Schnuerera ultunensis]
MNKTKYRIVDMKKFLSFIIITSITIAAIFFMLAKNQKVYSSTYKYNYREIIVKEGDTLWNIAIENMPKNYDVRKMVFEIKEFNQMVDANIYPGDLIKIPIKHNP